MASAGLNIGSKNTAVKEQAQGAEYGFPKSQVKADAGGVTRVQVPAHVADRFEHALAKHANKPESNFPDEKHKSGLEPVIERARNLTEVAEAKMRTGGKAETRTPNIGFPSKE